MENKDLMGCQVHSKLKDMLKHSDLSSGTVCYCNSGCHPHDCCALMLLCFLSRRCKDPDKLLHDAYSIIEEYFQNDSV